MTTNCSLSFFSCIIHLSLKLRYRYFFIDTFLCANKSRSHFLQMSSTSTPCFCVNTFSSILSCKPLLNNLQPVNSYKIPSIHSSLPFIHRLFLFSPVPTHQTFFLISVSVSVPIDTPSFPHPWQCPPGRGPEREPVSSAGSRAPRARIVSRGNVLHCVGCGTHPSMWKWSECRLVNQSIEQTCLKPRPWNPSLLLFCAWQMS